MWSWAVISYSLDQFLLPWKRGRLEILSSVVMWTLLHICYKFEKDSICNLEKQLIKFIWHRTRGYWEKCLESGLLKWKTECIFELKRYFGSHRWKDLNIEFDYKTDGFRPLSSNTYSLSGLSICGLPAMPQRKPFAFLWKCVRFLESSHKA